MLYIILLIFSFALTYLIKNYYIKNALFDEVNERSSHTKATPHGGGIAISITWFLGLSYLYFTSQIDSILFYALMVGSVISIVSFFDDLYDLSARLRLLVQSIVAIIGLYFIGGFHEIIGIENQLFTNIFAFFLIVWFINLYNFLDGINGYAGSEAVFLSLAGFLLFGGTHFIVLAVATLGFLYWNYGDAKIFMGDVGSTLIGYNVSIFTIYYSNQDSTGFWIWIVLFSLFWFDATLTLIRRKLNGENLSQAHRKHAYQRLVQSGWSHKKVTNYLVASNLLLLFLTLTIENIYILFFITLVMLYVMMLFIDKKKKFEKG